MRGPTSTPGQNNHLDTLLEQLNQREAVQAIISKIHQLGYSINIVADDSTWVSRFDIDTDRKACQITVGTQPMPTDAKRSRIFLDAAFSDSNILTYKTLHELGHLIAYILRDSEQITSLYRLAYDIRTGRRGGLTAMGNMPYYRSVVPTDPNQGPSREDLAELLGMYMYDPRYLALFLNTLKAEIPYKQAVVGLATITGDELQRIAGSINAIMTFMTARN